MIGEFAQALRERSAAPQGLTTWNGSDPAQRFAVYRNNVAVSLAEALRASFPLVAELVGDEYFAALAGHFVAERLPRARRLALYGADFGDFLEGFPPVAGLPYLPDMARLESARLEAIHAADAQALTARDFEGRDDLAALRLRLHPAVRLVSSRFRVASLALALEEGAALEGFDVDGAETALIARPALAARLRPARPGEPAFLRALGRGGTLADAAEAGAREDARFDPSDAFRGLVEDGLATAILIEES